MKYPRKPMCRAIAALTVPVSFLASGALYAQGGPVVEEILVTAQKAAESLQDVPIAITAMSGDSINDLGISDISEIGARTPGLTMSRFNIAQPQIFIRGIGSSDDSAFGDQSVGVFIDEVYIGRAGGADFDLMDLERVEVLRGPQGTLYGKNVVGGAINVVTSLPSQDYEAKIRATVGNYDRKDVRALVGGGLSETIAGKLTVGSVKRDGHSDSSLGGDLSDEDRLTARGQLLFTPVDDLEVLLTADWSKDRAAGNSRDSFGDQFVFFPWFAPGTPAAASPASADRFKNEKTVNGFQDRDVWGVSSKVYWQLPSVEFTSLTSYRSSEFDFQEDFSGSDANLVINNVSEDAHQFSQEFRFANEADDGSYNWLVGAYYFYEKVDRLDNNDFRGNDSAAFAAASPVPGLSWAEFLNTFNGYGFGVAPFNIFFDQLNETNSYAVFGQGGYQLTDDLRLILGARYTIESKDADINGYGFDPTGGFLAGTYDISVDETWEKFTPKISLSYQVNDEIMTYATYTEGFKSGGFNGSASSEAAAREGYDPEEAGQFEIGMKSMLFDNRLRLNVALFQIDYSDLQIFQLKNGGELVIDNAADAESSGVEVEATYAITDSFSVDATYAYLDTEYKDYITEGGVDNSGNALTRAPLNSYTLALTKHFDVGVGLLTLKADYSYRDEVFFTAENVLSSKGENMIGDDERELVDAYAALEIDNTGFEVKVWGKNLTDEEYRVHGIDGAGPFGLTENSAVVWGMPRTYGLTVTYTMD